ncbi:FHA domain-containing protein [Aetokthonos hydrillicola Thurmond2011]|jgi:hypothetical protein|uniref:FHA domain-containing protein n=1 Tax=Aetokthonos hydrillicola Thurmond2011 TaxID=2712845 RepID=A0AAP5I345_9CYAN|nr:FHA domain-containing protein [Aetokthonos hydrillicola]MBO3458304.1 FHA domain-containing protein [Aetokthonos hydrillicola CCALA 1050]MBW4585866.1 FHA domain-containing protein [Aetokthonos hydrillicola CCALA 1050]MDR9893909.1 FHA domain-containing protein [Aetokthonos hydrillicola Thurmond2011]
MSIYKCLKGHTSTEPDYCSKCGVKIQGIPEETLNENGLIPEVAKTNGNTIVCPDCTAPHEPKKGDFCEMCGYNFATGKHGEVPPLEMDLVTDKLSVERAEEASTKSVTKSVVEIVATIDPSQRSPDSPEPPSQPPLTIRLGKESNLIGRSSEIRGIYPEIPLDFDSAVSHRHALLNRLADGTFVLRDIGSTNGTKLNGVELSAMVDVPIKDGDEFTLGHWTKIKIREVRG